MTLSLYAATVPTFLQILGATRAMLAKAETWRDEQGLTDAEMLNWKLADDMWPLSRQLKQVVSHSAGAVAGVEKGLFAPTFLDPPASFAEHRAAMDEAIGALGAVDPAALDALVGGDMLFQFGERKMPFTAEDFLLTFSQPNFFFHATTAYGILRNKGVPVGKGDFLGALRLKVPA